MQPNAGPSNKTSHLLDQAEESVQRAAALMIQHEAGALASCQAELEAATVNLSQLLGHVRQTSADVVMRRRLEALRTNLSVFQAMCRQGTAFHRGLEQLDSAGIVGYSPNGVERAL